MSRLRQLRPPWADIVLAALVIAFIVGAGRHIDPGSADRALDGFAYGCMAVAGSALAFRRRIPLTVVVVVTAALLTYMLGNYPGGPVYTTLYFALYSLATIRDRRLAFAAAGVSSGALLAVGVVVHTGSERLVHLIFVAWAVAAVLFGDAMRNRRDRVTAIEERARHLEQSREDEARRRVAEERLRIARDLHDSVAHSMATINVQAGAAAHVIDRHPDQARDALHVIEQASREVLDELTAMLGVLRLDPGEQADRAPTPGLERVGDLVESARRAGVDVTLHAELPPVSQPVGVAAYRIVQESLTNVIRHAGSSTAARVTIATNSDSGLVVEVTDDGRGVNGSSPGAGVGIVGMQERAEATGGRLEAGPRPEGGFAVRATWAGHP